MGKIRVGAGKSTITVSGSLEKYLNHILDNVAPGIVRRLDRAVTDLQTFAIDNWPVGSDKDGHSIDKFEVGIRIVSAEKLEAYIINKAPYAYFIKSQKGLLNDRSSANIKDKGSHGQGGRNAWNELVRKPGLKKKELLVQQLTSDLAKLAGK